MYQHFSRHVAINLLALLCWCALPLVPTAIQSTITTAQTPSELVHNDWRRTKTGWERKSSWSHVEAPLPAATRLHPALLASLQLLLAIGSLLAFSDLKIAWKWQAWPNQSAFEHDSTPTEEKKS